MNWQFKIGIYPWRSFEKAHLLQSGLPFFDELVSCIQSASHEILFQVYIFEWDDTGKHIWEELLKAANKGVSVTLWADAYGSASFLAELNKFALPNNFKVHFYSPLKLLSRQPLGMRLHHKIMVFDRQVALIGGINISNHYKGTKEHLPWLDFGIKLTGAIAKDLSRICLRTGNRFKRIRFEPIPQQMQDKAELTQNQAAIRVLENNWFKGKFAISKQYKMQTRICQSELWIINSYFVPSNALLRLLKKAAKRNVKVNLILGGKSDVKLVKNAGEYFYHDLLKSGVKIYEFTESVLHAKLAFADDHWMCIGSYNLNHLSDFGSIECNVEINHKSLVTASKTQLLAYTLPRTNEVLWVDYAQKRSLISRIRNFISFQLLRIALNLLFFFQGNNKKLSKEISS